MVEFDLPSLITTPTTADLVLTNRGIDGAEVGDTVTLSDSQISLSPDGKKLTLKFDAGQLADGVYQLEVKSSVTGGAPLIIPGSLENRFFVLRGDWNGDGIVTNADFSTFAYWFLNETPPEYVDLRSPTGINAQDFTLFLTGFGKDLFPSANAPLVSESNGEGELEALFRTLVDPTDVNGDGSVSTRDALIVINELNRSGRTENVAWSKFDANQDGRITAHDALT